MSDVLKVEVLVTAYYFQRRFCWMLSSLSKQIGVNTVVNVIGCENDGFDVNTMCVSEYFKLMVPFDNFRVKYLHCNNRELINNRGSARNHQCRNLDDDTDFVLFADADHIYEHNFLKALVDKYYETPTSTGNDIFSVCRTSTDDLDGIEKMLGAYQYPCVIGRTVTKYLRSLSSTRVTSNVCAGNCQFVERNVLKHHLNDTYVLPDTYNDGGILNGSSKFQSDRVFRKRFDKIVKVKIKPKQYHLQHQRVDADGIDIKTQR